MKIEAAVRLDAPGRSENKGLLHRGKERFSGAVSATTDKILGIFKGNRNAPDPRRETIQAVADGKALPPKDSPDSISPVQSSPEKAASKNLTPGVSDAEVASLDLYGEHSVAAAPLSEAFKTESVPPPVRGETDPAGQDHTASQSREAATDAARVTALADAIRDNADISQDGYTEAELDAAAQVLQQREVSDQEARAVDQAAQQAEGSAVDRGRVHRDKAQADQDNTAAQRLAHAAESAQPPAQRTPDQILSEAAQRAPEPAMDAIQALAAQAPEPQGSSIIQPAFPRNVRSTSVAEPAPLPQNLVQEPMLGFGRSETASGNVSNSEETSSSATAQVQRESGQLDLPELRPDGMPETLAEFNVRMDKAKAKEVGELRGMGTGTEGARDAQAAQQERERSHHERVARATETARRDVLQAIDDRIAHQLERDDLSDDQRAIRDATRSGTPRDTATESAEQALVAGRGARAESSAVDRVQVAQLAARMESPVAATAPPAPEASPPKDIGDSASSPDTDTSNADDEKHDESSEHSLPDPESGSLAHRLEMQMGVSRELAQDSGFQQAYEIALREAEQKALDAKPGLLGGGNTKIEVKDVIKRAEQIKTSKDMLAARIKAKQQEIRSYFLTPPATEGGEMGSVLTDEQMESFVDLQGDDDFQIAFDKATKDSLISGFTDQERKQKVFEKAKQLTEQIKKERNASQKSAEQQSLEKRVQLGKQLESFGLDVNPYDEVFQQRFTAAMRDAEAQLGKKTGSLGGEINTPQIDLRQVAQGIVTDYRKDRGLTYADMQLVAPNMSAEDKAVRSTNTAMYENQKASDKKAIENGTFQTGWQRRDAEYSTDDNQEPDIFDSKEGGRVVSAEQPKDELDELMEEEADISNKLAAEQKSASEASADSPKEVPVTSEQPQIQLGEAVWRNKDSDQPVTVTGYLGEMNGRKYVSIEGSSSGFPLDEIEFPAQATVNPEEMAKQKEREDLEDKQTDEYDQIAEGLSAEELAKLKKPEGYDRSKLRKAQKEEAANRIAKEKEEQRKEEKKWDDLAERKAGTNISEYFGNPEDAKAYQSALERKAKRESDVAAKSEEKNSGTATETQTAAQREYERVKAEQLAMGMSEEDAEYGATIAAAGIEEDAPTDSAQEQSTAAQAENLTPPDATNEQEQQILEIGTQLKGAKTDKERKTLSAKLSAMIADPESRKKIGLDMALWAGVILGLSIQTMGEGLKTE